MRAHPGLCCSGRLRAVLLRTGAPAIDEQELERFASENLVGYQRPTRYRIVEALPRTPSIKVSQPAVRELFTTPD